MLLGRNGLETRIRPIDRFGVNAPAVVGVKAPTTTGCGFLLTLPNAFIYCAGHVFEKPYRLRVQIFRG
jgi:hypothetical protein